MIEDTGVLSDSVRYFHEGDPFANQYLFLVPYAGDYHCNQCYAVNREWLDTCLIMLVDSGELLVQYRGQERTVRPGMLALLDCHEQHFYRSGTDDLRMRWFHFTGNISFQYTQMLLNRVGFIFESVRNAEIESCCQRILMSAQLEHPNGHIISVTIHKLLVLLSLMTSDMKDDLEEIISQTVSYMESHYHEDLTVQQLAKAAALSPSYYIRQFKKYQDTTPHQFLQFARIRAAKQYLTTTSLSIEAIAIRCGFCNTSHFIMIFRKSTQLSPAQFRKMWRQ